MSESAQADRSPKHADIIGAAQELFGEVGYAKTGVREIADRAHIALGTLYSQFPDGKVGVLTAAMNERVERLSAYIAHSDETDPVEAFLDRVRRLNIEIVRDPFLRRTFLEQGRVSDVRLRQRGREIVGSFDDLAIAELRRLTKAGLTQCDDPEAVAAALRLTNVGWITAQAAGLSNVEHDRVLNVLIDAVRALIRPTKAHTAPKPASRRRTERGTRTSK
ncbi:TetR/AcrR family transcriptional regulator [Mycolicibacterium porcinum]